MLQFEDALKNGASPPEVAVFTFNWFHLARNTLAPEWIRSIGKARRSGEEGKQETLSYPKAFLIDSKLQIQMILLDLEGEAYRDIAENDEIDIDEQIDVTKQVFTSIDKICESYGIRHIVAVLAEDNSPEGSASVILDHCRSLGFEVADISVPLDAQTHSHNRLWDGRNGHPNRAVHSVYAERLLDVLQENRAK